MRLLNYCNTAYLRKKSLYMDVLLCVIRKKVVSLQKISRKKMKSKFLIWTIGAMALCLMSACANGDVQRVQKAEELLPVNRDSAMAILRGRSISATGGCKTERTRII